MIPSVFIVDDEGPARARMKMLLSDIAAECPHKLIGEAGHARAALDAVQELQPDIVLLDVQMPGMTGIELAAHLARTPKPPAVIFVSAYDEYALKAFDVHALDYLLKPVRASRLADALRRVVALRGQASPGAGVIAQAASAMHARRKHFSVQERGRVLLIPVADVIYLKAELKYVTMHTMARDYLIEESLLSIEEEHAATFVRVHRNALVAREAIVGVERGTAAVDSEADGGKSQEAWQVILRGAGERLPISRRQWPIIKALVR